VTYNAAAVAGPGLVALLAALGFPAAAMPVLAAAAGCAAVLTALLPPIAPLDGPPPARLRRDLAEGLRTVWRRRELRAVTAATCLAFLGLGGLTGTGVLFAARSGRGSAGGLLLTAFALGALAGTLLLTRPWARAAPRRLAVAGLVGTGAGLAVAAAVPVLPVAVGGFAGARACDGPFLTATLRNRAAHSPPHRLAQVFTLGAGLKVSAAAAGAALAAAATVHSAPRYLLGIAALQLAAALLYTALGRGARD